MDSENTQVTLNVKNDKECAADKDISIAERLNDILCSSGLLVGDFVKELGSFIARFDRSPKIVEAREWHSAIRNKLGANYSSKWKVRASSRGTYPQRAMEMVNRTQNLQGKDGWADH